MLFTTKMSKEEINAKVVRILEKNEKLVLLKKKYGRKKIAIREYTVYNVEKNVHEYQGEELVIMDEKSCSWNGGGYNFVAEVFITERDTVYTLENDDKYCGTNVIAKVITEHLAEELGI